MVRERLALGLLVVSTVVAVWGVPAASWRTSGADPCHLATIAGVATVLLLVVARFLGERAQHVERLALAAFLAAMPLVYVASWFWARPGGEGTGWLWIELAALPVYAGLALLGLRRSPWLLVAGIAGHGLLWDAWHHGRTSFVPDWYATGCRILRVRGEWPSEVSAVTDAARSPFP